LAVLFIAAAVSSFAWPIAVRRLPLTIAVPGAIFAIWALFIDWRQLREATAEAGGLVPAIKRAAEVAILNKAGAFLGYLVCLIVVGYFVGQFIALPLFIAAYLWRWGGYGWPVCLGYAAAGWVILFGFYDQVMHIMWHVPLLAR
jgi:putative tricarboxylic transport membrane protein